MPAASLSGPAHELAEAVVAAVPVEAQSQVGPFPTEIGGRVFGHERDHSAEGIAAIKRRGRATENLHAVDAVEIECERWDVEVPELVSHIHLPVQSGSDRILMQMKRGHTVLEYKHKIRQLQKARPGISISSDFIIGFPGETDDDFKATMKLIEDIGFDTSFSFIYSQRPGTPAAFMPDDVDDSVKKQRLSNLQSRILQFAAEISRNMVGTEQTLLVEGFSRKDDKVLAGRTENNRVVNFAGPEELIGQFVKVNITEALNNSLRARLKSQ